MFRKNIPCAAMLLALVVSLFFVSTVARAQSQASTGNIEGRVLDPNGAAVPNVQVTATNEATGLQKSANTDDEGNYRIILLPPGTYTVRAEKTQGFAQAEFQNVQVTVGGKTPLEIKLSPAGVKVADINVTSELPTVETTRTSVSTTINQRSIVGAFAARLIAEYRSAEEAAKAVWTLARQNAWLREGEGAERYLLRKPIATTRNEAALDLIGVSTKGAQAPASSPAGPPLDTAKLAQIVGHMGEQSGSVYKITIGRDDLKVSEMGAPINARMGLNTWAAFVPTAKGGAAIAGDVAMLESEVTPVLKALRTNGLQVVAIHHHMTNERPMIVFLHYWGTGPAETLAAGFKAAVDELGKHNTSRASRN